MKIESGQIMEIVYNGAGWPNSPSGSKIIIGLPEPGQIWEVIYPDGHTRYYTDSYIKLCCRLVA